MAIQPDPIAALAVHPLTPAHAAGSLELAGKRGNNVRGDERNGSTTFRHAAVAFKLAAGGLRAVNPPEKDALLFIAQVEYRRHAIKIARRGNQIRLLIHRPGSLLAA